MDDNNLLRKRDQNRIRARNYRRRTKEVNRALQDLTSDTDTDESEDSRGQSRGAVTADSLSESVSTEHNVSPPLSPEGRGDDEHQEENLEQEEIHEHVADVNQGEGNELEEDSEQEESDEPEEDPEQEELLSDELEEDEEVAENRNEIDELRQWAIDCNIPQLHLDKLLRILGRRLLPELPKSSKTLLETNSSNYEIRQMEDGAGDLGEYVYLGIEKGILECVNGELHNDQTIELQVNIDGLPLFESSNKQFWPILCKIYCNPDVYKPFVAALYCGNTKPKSVEDYFEDFVAEINSLHINGVIIGGRRFEVKIQCFICDTPARSFIACTKGHGGYSACERCTVRGVRYDKRTIYPDTTCPARSDRTFRDLSDPEHHIDISPLTMIEPPLDMVSSIVLDSMHLYALVMKKIMTEMWLGGIGGRQKLRTNLPPRCKAELNRRLESLKAQTPCEFQRKPRSAKYVLKWKATEFRFFLLYCGPIVMKNLLDQDRYDHFLLLHTACRILSSDELCLRYLRYAKIYLLRFFEALRRLYSRQSQILSMHNLIHLADDVRNMGCSLSRITAFPFENFLGKLKNRIRTPNLPLSQLCRRLHESSSIPHNRVAAPPMISILKSETVQNNTKIVISKLFFQSVTLTTSLPNNLVMLNDGTILLITQMSAPVANPQNVKIGGKVWEVKKSLFSYPTDSKVLKMFELCDEPSDIVAEFYIQRVQHKMVIFELDLRLNGRKITNAMPLLHH